MSSFLASAGSILTNEIIVLSALKIKFCISPELIATVVAFVSKGCP